MAKDLSQRQKKILLFVREFIEVNRIPPTIRDIAKGVGITSTASVKYSLDTLERKRLIERSPDISRSIRLAVDPTDYPSHE